MPDDNLREQGTRHREMLIACVREAGAIALKAFGSDQQTWMKPGNSPVSAADMAVDAFLRTALVGAAPGYGWLSEESADDPARLDAGLVWVVDPIDGTRAYIAGRTDWAVSVALVAAGRPVLAVLYAPATEEIFVAQEGAGASLNGAPLRAAQRADLVGALAAGPQPFLRRLAAAEPSVVQSPKIHSLALRLARVADGTLDIAFASGSAHDWDLAAADLLVHEAGGVMTDFAGRPVLYNQPAPVHAALVAAGRPRHDVLLDLLRERPLQRA